VTWDPQYPMDPQVYSWTCSVCSWLWAIEATGTATMTREQAGVLIGYPECVNETYGLMSAQCLIDAYASQGLIAHQAWVSFDQAYAIAGKTTGQLNGIGWYHFVSIRGVADGTLWIANSAPGYAGVGDTLTREMFNALGPFQVIYLEQPQPAG
jgi:hypothetical protein